jgi:hypothetical protein
MKGEDIRGGSSGPGNQWRGLSHHGVEAGLTRLKAMPWAVIPSVAGADGYRDRLMALLNSHSSVVGIVAICVYLAPTVFA